MTTQEEDFRIRLVALLKDLQQGGADDGEAMFLLGSLAAGLADDLKSPNWVAAKAAMTPGTRDDVLRTFQDQGNRHHREGRAKQAYAIQALAMSLIAATLRFSWSTTLLRRSSASRAALISSASQTRCTARA